MRKAKCSRKLCVMFSSYYPDLRTEELLKKMCFYIKNLVY